jgi:hypothetical protein
VPGAVRIRYWKWVDDALLKLVQEEQRQLYDEIIRQVRTIIDEGVAKAKSEYGK